MIPEGRTIAGKPPDNLHDYHFGLQLLAYVLRHGSAVTQPQLLELLLNAGISISTGQLSNLLTKGNGKFHAEKDKRLITGIRRAVA